MTKSAHAVKQCFLGSENFQFKALPVAGVPIGPVDRFHIPISPIGGISNRFLRNLAFTVGTILHSLAQPSLSG